MRITSITQPGARPVPELQPTLELSDLARSVPRYAFSATDSATAQGWQVECRQALVDALGFLDSPRVDPAPEILGEVDRGDFVQRRILIWTGPQTRMPVYLLIPKPAARSGARLPVALAYAGHGYGVKDIVGLWEDGSERTVADGYQKDFGVALCRRGFLVAAPEIACFGERQTDYAYLDRPLGQEEPTTCHNAATYAIMLGKSVAGMRVRDGMRLVDYVSTLPEADTSRLGAMGISGGGMLTFFHTAVDPRIRACVISGYYSSFKASLLAMNHCTCNFVPGLLNIGEMCDLVGLILPRPMLIEAGTRDPIFPIATVRASVERARQVCAALGGDPAKDVELDEFEGRHMVSGRRAYDFLWERV